jgi:enoyl-CoA hydratase
MASVLYEVKNNIGIITLDRQQALNALNLEMLSELSAVLENVDRKHIRCLIITGAGERAFVSGADISEMCPFTKLQAKNFSRQANDLFLDIERFPIPIIAVVKGYALGGGLELALACDIRICAEGSVFGLPEVGLGVTPGFGGTQRLSRIVGMGRAKEIMYTSTFINHEEAYRIGLANHIYSKEEVTLKALEMAETIALKAPIAVRMCKQAINRGEHMDICAAVDEEAEVFGDCFETSDQIKAMTNFMNKDKKKIEFENK